MILSKAHWSAVAVQTDFDFYLFGRAVAGHLDPVLPLVDQDGHDEEDDDSQEDAGQNPGC